jgi:hypothetical protein
MCGRPWRWVEFRDIDMNQHYTVEMIIARSVDGVEQLMVGRCMLTLSNRR